MKIEDFPILQEDKKGRRIIYLDSAATSQKPIQVIEAVKEYYENDNANVHRGIHRLSVKATLAYEGARKKVADFIVADEKEIVFTKGTTEGLNLLAYCLGKKMQPGDEIVLTEMEHHSNIIPWQQMAKEKGILIGYIPIKKDFTLDMDQAKKIINKKTKIVSLTWMSNVLGTINPVQKIGQMAHSAGAKIIIDAAQYVAHSKINVKEINCDFLVFSGHKMLGPTGIGILYGKKEELEKMVPYQTGGGMIEEVSLEKSSFADIPARLEAGTPNIAGAVGLAAAIEYLQQIGMDKIEKHGQDLSRYFLEKIKQLREEKKIRLIGPDVVEGRGAVFSFVVEGQHPHDISEELDKKSIAVRAGHHCAMPLHEKLMIKSSTRVSFYLYNSKEEVDILVEELNRLCDDGTIKIVSKEISKDEISKEILSEEQEMYKENIMDHYNNPRNKKELNKYDLKHKEVNPVCGDTITLYIKLDAKKKIIKEISFQGHGCAISQASVSILTEELKEKTIDDVKELKENFIFDLLGIPISPGRVKCALLGLKALHKGIEHLESKL